MGLEFSKAHMTGRKIESMHLLKKFWSNSREIYVVITEYNDCKKNWLFVYNILLDTWQNKTVMNPCVLGKFNRVFKYIFTSCGHVVRDFESEAKTRCNFQFRLARRHWFNEIFKNDNVQGLRSKFRKIVLDPLFFGQKNYKGLLFYW